MIKAIKILLQYTNYFNFNKQKTRLMLYSLLLKGSCTLHYYSIALFFATVYYFIQSLDFFFILMNLSSVNFELCLQNINFVSKITIIQNFQIVIQTRVNFFDDN